MIRKAILLTAVLTCLPAAAFADDFSFSVSFGSGYRDAVVVHREPVVVHRTPVVVERVRPVPVKTVCEVRPAPVKVVTCEPVVRVERKVEWYGKTNPYKPAKRWDRDWHKKDYKKHDNRDNHGKHYAKYDKKDRHDRHYDWRGGKDHHAKPKTVCYDRPVYKHYGR